MASTTTILPDVRIRAAFETLLGLLNIQHAEYHYTGGKLRPGTQTFTTGTRLTRAYRLKQLKKLLGNDGYIDDVTWRPVRDEMPVIVVRFRLRLRPDDGIEFSDGHRVHTVGLTRTRFVPADCDGRPEQVQRVFHSEPELIHYILDVAKQWRDKL